MSKLNPWLRACGILVLWATTAIAVPAQTFTTVHSFDGTDGTNPYAALVQGTNGNLYGTTYEGGANNEGTVFQVTLNGTLTTLHSFADSDGAFPYGGLVQGSNGNFYGATYEGGANEESGTVFKITPSGTLTTLHSFDNADGYLPYATLVQGTNGDFYGTTEEGGANSEGTVFKITASGTLTTLHSFDGADGAFPTGGLLQATNGSFYGTTRSEGVNNGGTVFKITPSGTLTTLYNFCSRGGVNCTDGDAPRGTLVQGTDGNFYGTTSLGGANSEGSVFRITPSGRLMTVYSFCAQTNCTDGDQPYAGLVLGSDGNFYGTTLYGGATAHSNAGTIFEITPSGVLTTLYIFCPESFCTDGESPEAGLIQDTNGTFYGTTQSGGASLDGAVFSLSVGLGPFVATQPTLGKAGTAVKILGTSLTGATSVTFNGIAATFTVKSRSEITTTVPTGATTGTVQIVTPGGTLSSNVPFTVKP